MSPARPTRELQTVSYVSGPLLFLERVVGVGAGEEVEVITPAGEARRGEILEIDGERAVVEVFAGTQGLDSAETKVRPLGHAARVQVGSDLLGRVLDGSGGRVTAGRRSWPRRSATSTGRP